MGVHFHRSARRSALAALLVVIAGTLASRAQAPRADSIIIGRVVEDGTGAPIPLAVISLRNAKDVVDQVRATDDGWFAFRDLPAGTYVIGAVKPGYQSMASARQRVELTVRDGDLIDDVVVALRRYSSISGTVGDQNGNPMTGAPVHLLRRGARGQWSASAPTYTDDRGLYTFPLVASGDFVVAVIATHASAPASSIDARGTQPAAELPAQVRRTLTSILLGTSDADLPPLLRAGDVMLSTARVPHPAEISPDGRAVVYPTLFHPGASSVDAARVLQVGGGQEFANVDFQLTPVPGVEVSGILRVPPGVSPAHITLNLLPAGTGRMSRLLTAATITDGDGRFTFPAVPAGSYTLETVMRSPASVVQSAPAAELQTGGGAVMVRSSVSTRPGVPEGPTLWLAEPLAVGSDPIRNLAPELQTGARVLGRIRFDGAASPPEAGQLAGAPVHIWSVDGPEYFVGRFDASGAFATEELPSGRYAIRIAPMGRWQMKAVLTGRLDHADLGMEIRGQPVDGVVVVMTDRLASVSGSVRDVRGRAVANATVLLFPVERRFWPTASRSTYRLKTTRTSRDGAFRLPPVPAGEYFAVALADDPPPYLDDAAFLSALAPLAPRVTLAEGGAPHVELRTIDPPRTSREVAPVTAGQFRQSKQDEATIQRHESEAREHGPFAVDEQDQLQPRDVVSRADGGAIAGTVVHESDGRTPVRSASVAVIAIATGKRQWTLTGDDGQFVVGDLPPGRYRVVVSKAAYLTAEPGAKRSGRPGVPIAVTAGATAVITCALRRGSVIAGTVYGSDGRPAVAAGVRVLSLRARDDVPALIDAPSATPSEAVTDHLGRYRIYGLAPGEYYVGASPGSGGSVPGRPLTAADIAAARRRAPVRRSADERPRAPAMYVPTFYPATVALGEAASVVIAPGEERAGTDIHLQLRTAVSVRGRVVDAAGAPAGPVRLAVVPSGAHIPVDNQMVGAGGSGQAASMGGAVQVTTARDGSFSVNRLSPGRYTLFASTGTAGQGSEVATALMEITLGEEDIPELSMALRPAATVRGQLTASDDPAPDWSRVTISLRSIGAAPVAVHPPPGAVEASGAFSVRGVLPGRYWLTLEGLPDGWAMTAASVTSRDAFEAPLDVNGEDTAPLTIHLTHQPTTRLAGTFSDRSGRPVSDYLVIAFPEERTRWQSPSRRIQAVRPASDGGFVFTGLPPGAYRLAAVMDAAEDDLHDPAFLEVLHAAGISVTVRSGERTVQDIRSGGRP